MQILIDFQDLHMHYEMRFGHLSYCVNEKTKRKLILKYKTYCYYIINKYIINYNAQ